MSIQIIQLQLEGITAADYLTWTRDPEPPALDFALRSVTVEAEPLGDEVYAVLEWKGDAPVPHVAAPAAGLPLTAEVRTVRGDHLALPCPEAPPAPQAVLAIAC